jgi:hypothetical protein
MTPNDENPELKMELLMCTNCEGIYRVPGVTECDCAVGEKPTFKKLFAYPEPRPAADHGLLEALEIARGYLQIQAFAGDHIARIMLDDKILPAISAAGKVQP